MRTAIVIVNYRTSTLVYDCLYSLSSQRNSDLDQVIVVDNHSDDGSVEYLTTAVKAQKWETWATIVPQKTNRGFAAGNNAAINYLMGQDIFPDAVMLLNPDTVVHPGCLQQLADFLTRHPAVGIVGAQLMNQHHVPESSSRRYPSVLSELDAGARLGLLSRLLRNWQVPLPTVDHAHQCDWVSGAAMMVRREVLEQIGLLDEGFFLYFEELDYCRRAGDAGWQVWLEPTAMVTHFEGQATGIKKVRQRRGKYWYDSRRRYFIKHAGVTRWVVADLLWGLGRFSLLLRRGLNLGGDVTSDPLYYTLDLLWGDFCALVSGEVWRIRFPASDCNKI